MKTQYELLIEANRIRQELSEKHTHLAEKLLPIRFEISGRMTRAAGTAYPKRNLIKLSLAFFADENNFAKDFRNTVTHEIAHILVPPTRCLGRSNRDAHGHGWRLMHLSFGGTGERCHEMDLSTGYTARRSMVQIPCSKCGQMIDVSPVRAARYRAGKMRYSHVRCPSIG